MISLPSPLTALVPTRWRTCDAVDDTAPAADDESAPAEDPPPAEAPDDTAAADQQATDPAARVAPSGVDLGATATQVDDHWVTVLFVTGFPETATPGLLDRVCTHPSADIDVSLHLAPTDPERSRQQFERAIKSLKVDHIEARDQGSAKATATARRLQAHQAVYEQLQSNGQQVLDVGVYLTIRGATEAQVEQTATRLRRTLQHQQLTAKPAAYRQADALTTGSPIATDALDQTTPMLGQAAGALFPFAAQTLIEDEGVLYGYHATTDAPIYVDRFARENGHNVLVAGEIGSGKSYTTKTLLLRRLARDGSTGLVMLDPVGGFAALADRLDAEHYVIGGTQTVNPLELHPTPPHLLETTGVDPLAERLSAVMALFASVFAYTGAPLGDRRPVLERCVRAAYARQGITADPATHDRPSPVIDDVRAVLGDVAADPATVLDADSYAPDELATWQEHAADLRVHLEPFTAGGQFAFLNGPTEVDLTDSRVVYLDLQQFGGGADTALAGLVMQPLYDAVYERLKTTTGHTIIAIDEAHYLVEAPGSVAWLTRTTRHSRHLDLSLQFVTQELADFYDADGAETFINQSSIKLLHRQGGLQASHADALGLTDPQAAFVRDAVVGKDGLGYSTALLDVDEAGTYPLRVTALPEEEAVIEAPGDTDAGSDAAGDDPDTAGLVDTTDRPGDEGEP